MKTMRLFLSMMLLLGTATGFAQDASGTCGDNLTWTLASGTLIISGNGEMKFSGSQGAPWRSYRTSITSVVIEGGVTNIYYAAFSEYSNLTSVSIGNGVKSIQDNAFRSCSSLPSVTIPESVTNIGNYVFSGCSNLASITIGNGVTSIEEHAFDGCSSLTSVSIPNNVTSIGKYAFYHCSSLASVSIGNGVTSISVGTFSDCGSLTSVTIGNGVTSIGDYAFKNCSSLASVSIPGSVASIGEWAFSDCSSLASVSIGNGVTSIGGSAFSDCSSLTSVTIGNSVTSIAGLVFSDCSKLISVTNLNPEPQTIPSTVFATVIFKNATLYVPAASVNAYKAKNVWKNFYNITEYIPSAIESPVAEGGIGIYPNPVTESFRIDGITAPTQVIVTDLSGRTVWTQTISGNEPVAVGHWPQGIYLVRAGSKTLKVVKR
jgi:hypothetical protein